MTTPEVKRWREMAERFHAALEVLRHPPYSDEAAEEYHKACVELHFASPTAIPAMARMIEEREAEIERLKEELRKVEHDRDGLLMVF